MEAVSSKTFHVRTSLGDNIGKQGGSNLFGLEMSGLDEENVRMSEPRMIVHLTREVGVGTQ